MSDDGSGAAPPRPSQSDLEPITDPAAFGAALRRVREHRHLTLRGMERYLGGLTDRPPDRWSKSKIEQAEKGERLEERWVLRYLAAVGVPGPELPPWVMALRRAVDTTPAPPQTAPRAASPQVSNLGPRNRVFTGRERALEALRARLRAEDVAVVGTGAGTGTAAVHGLGGVGKTELVREFAHRFAGDYELIWWIPAEQPTTAAASLATLAGPLGLPAALDQGETVEAVLAALRERARWLLVYDNAEHPDALSGLVPPLGAGHVVVTSRWRAWSEVAEPLRLDTFDRAESVRYLTRRASGPAADRVLGELAELLGDLPLALAEAAAYLEHTQLDAEQYLGLVRERARDLFGLAPTGGQAPEWGEDARRVATVWSLSLEKVRAQAPAAEALMTLLAFLGPDDVPRDLARAHPGAPRCPDAAAAETGGPTSLVSDPLLYNGALAVLGRYSMITLAPDAIGMHRLVQAVVRARLADGAERRWAAVATGLVRAAFPPGDMREPAIWPTCGRLLPHLLAVCEHAERHGTASANAGWLLDRASKYLREHGRYSQALPLARRALAATTTAVGAEHPDVADRRDELGRVLEPLGERAAARVQCEEAVRIGVAALGPDHLHVGYWRHTLGAVLWHLGEPAAARRECEESLRIGLLTLAPGHPDIGRRRNNLGLVLQELGERAAARREYEEALRIGRATLDPDHVTLATWHNNLGVLLQETGEPVAARREVEEAVRIGLTTLGPEHPSVGLFRHSLALILRELGDAEGAERELTEALRISTNVFGPDHPETEQIRRVLHAEAPSGG